MNEPETTVASTQGACSLHEDDMRLTVGRRVRSGVWVGGTWQPMALGIIVSVHSGYCDVDIMGLHGGAPWVVQYANTSLREEPHIDPSSATAADGQRGAQPKESNGK